MAKQRRLLTGAALLLVLLPALPLQGTTPASAADFADQAFKRVWTRTDKVVADGMVKRSFYWGPAPGESRMEPYAQGVGGMRRVQYFDKSRMEINNPAGDRNNPFFVTNGLLTVELVSGKMQVGNAEYSDRTPANIPLASDNDDANAPTYASFAQLANTPLGDHTAENLTGQTVNQRVNKAGQVSRDAAFDKYGVKYGFYNTETKHNIAGQIWDFLNSSGPVTNPDGRQANARLSEPWFYTTGYAISEPYWANVKVAGKQTDVLVQLFERRVVTYQPDAPQGFKVQMGNIGAHYYDWRYRSEGQQTSVFAEYKLQPSTVIPAVRPYTVAKGLSNVTNVRDFELSPAARALIEQNAFVAQFPKEEQYKQFYQLYEDGRYASKPIFVTTDSVLHVYHLMFDKLLRSTETKYLIADLKGLNAAMLQASMAQYESLRGTAAESAAKRNVGYFALASKLIDPNVTVPALVQAEVSQDLAQIDAHQGLGASAVFGIGSSVEYLEDFSQYVPRGHYTRSEDLKRYFRAMMWYGRMTFRLNSVEETKSALLITQALQTAKSGDKTAAALWARIYEPTSFFVGGSDDLTYLDYAPLMQQALGSDPRAVADNAKVAQFQELAKTLEGPKVNSMFVYITEDKEAVTKGLRMMGQRFTLDAYVFGQLIWRNVGNPNGSDAEKRWLPKGLDVPAAFGSQEAVSILEGLGETKYMSYTLQLNKVRGEINSLSDSQWTENLYWSWLYSFRPLLQPKAANSGYPSFMTNSAWTRKNLNTVLGSWTELKHDTILYAKQVMAEMGGGPPETIKGYVEPEPEFYARIAALIGMTRDGLLARGLLEKTAEDAFPATEYSTLTNLYNLALDLKRISEKELSNQWLTEEEYSLIQYYGGRLENITIAAADEETEGGGDLNDQDAAVVADVATGGPGGDLALEEGTGRIMEIYAVVPVEGRLMLARGGIYSQYEFVQPSSNRLTDEQWREMVERGQLPPLGDWKTFIAK
ncbi:MAG TPA: DUF3160 domain-containing protein [Chloroflexia bacterium]